MLFLLCYFAGIAVCFGQHMRLVFLNEGAKSVLCLLLAIKFYMREQRRSRPTAPEQSTES